MDASQFDPSVLLTLEGLKVLFTLTVLEIVLGIDNIIVISILSGELPTRAEQRKAQRLGLSLAMITRVLLLLSISWMASMTQPLFTVGSIVFTGRGLVLSLGGLFLIWKAGKEIFELVEGDGESTAELRKRSGMGAIVLQIVLIDIVFSLDSVITAVGMSNELIIMVLAVIFAVLIMLFASGTIADFVNKNATVKVLALTFLVLVGVVLLIDGFGGHVNKNYMYAAMGFCVLVEALNLRMRRNRRRRRAGED